MVALPFSKRTTTAVTVFACLQASKDAQKINTVTVPQISALQLEMATLFSVYRQVLHQDVANQASVLDGVIEQAATVIGQLITTLQGLTQPNPPEENAFALTDLQVLVANAVVVMANVQSAE